MGYIKFNRTKTFEEAIESENKDTIYFCDYEDRGVIVNNGKVYGSILDYSFLDNMVSNEDLDRKIEEAISAIPEYELPSNVVTTDALESRIEEVKNSIPALPSDVITRSELDEVKDSIPSIPTDLVSQSELEVLKTAIEEIKAILNANDGSKPDTDIPSTDKPDTEDGTITTPVEPEKYKELDLSVVEKDKYWVIPLEDQITNFSGHKFKIAFDPNLTKDEQIILNLGKKCGDWQPDEDHPVKLHFYLSKTSQTSDDFRVVIDCPIYKKGIIYPFKYHYGLKNPKDLITIEISKDCLMINGDILMDLNKIYTGNFINGIGSVYARNLMPDEQTNRWEFVVAGLSDYERELELSAQDYNSGTGNKASICGYRSITIYDI